MIIVSLIGELLTWRAIRSYSWKTVIGERRRAFSVILTVTTAPKQKKWFTLPFLWSSLHFPYRKRQYGHNEILIYTLLLIHPSQMFWKYPQTEDKIQLLHHTSNKRILNLQILDVDVLNMTTKLEHSNTASITYWAILNHLFYNKNIPAIPPLFVDGSFTSD